MSLLDFLFNAVGRASALVTHPWLFLFLFLNSHIWPQPILKYWGFYRPLSFAWSYSPLLCHTNWLDKEEPELCEVLLLQGEM